MNKIRAIQALNEKEIEQGVSPEASWHTDYRDTAFIYFGGMPYELSEGDIITIFSQYGEPVFIKLARDKDTGKSKGFGWLKYHDQRSTDLAVDNLGGADILGRIMSVDHARYKPRDDEDQEEFKVGWEDLQRKEGRSLSDGESSEGEGGNREKSRPLLPEEAQLEALLRDHDDDDPMKQYLIDEKKKEVDEARRRSDKRERRHKIPREETVRPEKLTGGVKIEIDAATLKRDPETGNGTVGEWITMSRTTIEMTRIGGEILQTRSGIDGGRVIMSVMKMRWTSADVGDATKTILMIGGMYETSIITEDAEAVRHGGVRIEKGFLE
ncbi:U2 snRNP component IST3 [Ophiocordyceps camponoti-floridani]|uniref:U2 snRNP component IST3 n=1 Tax=Ophiocordyceps camponoti-floridani TaxID=2030778 RepID=A0A8H4Q5L8_9HYPO|nr:U2 snRNP component IST3 [Ophiocordyceps camponoti-floridani]